MPSFRNGTVTAILSERRGLQRVEVDGEPAYVLTQLIGPVAVGDRVVVNTTAVELGLGTGGWHVVHWNLSSGDSVDIGGGGHVMKLRYTSLQTNTGVAEENEESPDDLAGAPVVVLALHSQLATAAAAVKVINPSLRVVYVMTDAGSLPIALSDLVAELCEAGFVDATVTAGHAFGGDMEAVNVRSALGVARHRLRADVVVVGMGPGSVGTATATGFSGLEVGANLDTVRDAGGIPIMALRVSDADPRQRHRGVSQHSLTALSATHVEVVVPVPTLGHEVPISAARVSVVPISEPNALGALAAKGITPTTMGRDAAADPLVFSFAAAAGAYAAQAAGR